MALITYDDKSNSLPTSNPRRIFRDIDANEIKNVVNENAESLITREFNRAFSAELLFDKNEIDYAPHTQTDDITFTLADNGHLVDQFSSAIHTIEADGIHPFYFEYSGTKFIYPTTIFSGFIPDAGTYQIFFMYRNGIWTVNWAFPSFEVANLTALTSPANFEAIPGTDPDTEVDLSWDAVPNVSSYEIYYSVVGASGPWISLTNPSSGSTSYTHSGLTEGTTYYYRIRAIGDQVVFANSGYSTSVTTTEDSGDVSAPTFTFDPADAETDVPVNGVVVITSSAPLRDQDGTTVITDANLSDYITVKEDDGAGADIPHTKTIDATKTIITITPNVIWPALGNVFIQIDGVESSINGVHAVADDATFTVSDFTLTQLNRLDFGDILDTVIAADNADFNVKFTSKDLLIDGGEVVMFRKHLSVLNGALLVSAVNTDVVFKFYGGNSSNSVIREITWANVLTPGEHDYNFHYKGAVDTNNGLDRVDLRIDTVLQGSKSLTLVSDFSGFPWPFKIKDVAAPLRIGPNVAQVKDIIITSTNDTVTELNVPIMRTGLDVSGNGRHGTWG